MSQLIPIKLSKRDKCKARGCNDMGAVQGYCWRCYLKLCAELEKRGRKSKLIVGGGK